MVLLGGWGRAGRWVHHHVRPSTLAVRLRSGRGWACGGPFGLCRNTEHGAGPDDDVAAAQSDELADPQAGLHRQDQQGVIATANPGRAIRCCQQRLELWPGEEGDDLAIDTLLGDCEDPLDKGAVFVGEGGEVEERVHGGEPGVAGAGTVVADGFEVLKEGVVLRACPSPYGAGERLWEYRGTALSADVVRCLAHIPADPARAARPARRAATAISLPSASRDVGGRTTRETAAPQPRPHGSRTCRNTLYTNDVHIVWHKSDTFAVQPCWNGEW